MTGIIIKKKIVFYFTLTALRNDLNYLSRLNATIYVRSFIILKFHLHWLLCDCK